MQTWVWQLVLVIFVVLLAYGCGRRVGLHQGRKNGESSASIVMRAEAFRTGVCPVCSMDSLQVVQLSTKDSVGNPVDEWANAVFNQHLYEAE